MVAVTPPKKGGQNENERWREPPGKFSHPFCLRKCPLFYLKIKGFVQEGADTPASGRSLAGAWPELWPDYSGTFYIYFLLRPCSGQAPAISI